MTHSINTLIILVPVLHYNVSLLKTQQGICLFMFHVFVAEKLSDCKDSAKVSTISSKEHPNLEGQQVNQHLPDLVSSHCSDSASAGVTDCQSSYHPDLTDSTCLERSSTSLNSVTSQQVSPSAAVSPNQQSSDTANNMEAGGLPATERPLSLHMNNSPDQISDTDYYNQDSITRNRVNNTISSAAATTNVVTANTSRGRSSSTSAAPLSLSTSGTSEDNLSSGVYMNDSQLSSSMMNVSAADITRKMSTCSSITPEMDPRNHEYPPPGKKVVCLYFTLLWPLSVYSQQNCLFTCRSNRMLVLSTLFYLLYHSHRVSKLNCNR